MQETDSTRAPSGTRQIAFAVLCFVFGGAALGALFGIGIVIGWFDTTESGIHRVHDIGFGVAYGVLTATAFFAMMSRRARRASVVDQIVAVAGGVMLASLLATDLGYLVLAVSLVVAVAIVVAVHPDRRVLLAWHPDLSPVLGAFAFACAVPLVGAALTWARYQREGSPLDPHVAQAHWTTMASMSLALVLTLALASLRLPGWRLTAWCAGAGLAAYGLASIVFDRFPGTSSPYPGSEGLAWGVAALIGGLVFAAMAELVARAGGHDTDASEPRTLPIGLPDQP